MEEQKLRYLPLFIKKYNSSIKFMEMIKRYVDKSGGATYSVEDIRNLRGNEQLMKINMAIAARKRHLYSADWVNGLCLTALQLSREEFVVMLSVDEADVNGKRILKACFESVASEPIALSERKKAVPFEATRAYKCLLPKPGVEPCTEYDGKWKISGERINETFTLSDELKDYIKASREKSVEDIKVNVAIIWGHLLSKYINKDKVLVRGIHEGGILRSIPIIVDRKMDYSKQYLKLKKEYEDARINDTCTSEVLSSELWFDYEKLSLMSYEFFEDSMYDDFLERMKDDLIYRIEPYVEEMTPLSVRCSVVQNTIDMTYDYDKSFLKGADILVLHNIFVGILTKAVFKIDVNAKAVRDDASLNEEKMLDRVEEAKQSQNDSGIRREEAKRELILQIPLFGDLSADEFEILMKKSHVVRANMEEDFINNGDYVDSIYILVSGRVEMGGVGNDRYYRPLLLLKEMDIFGVESMLTNTKSANSYKVSTKDAYCLKIMKADYLELAANHPELHRALLDTQSDRLKRLCKLWMLAE